MCSEPRYSIVDLSEWSRGNLFKYYIEHMRAVMSLTFDIDVAPLIRYGKRNSLKFYPAMLWVVSKAVNDHDELYGVDAGVRDPPVWENSLQIAKFNSPRIFTSEGR